MPRLSRRCETLTPKMRRLHPFLSCFFDLPLKNVLQILNVSHHTLDPIRRSMGMKKWPFVDIVRGKYCQRDEIVAMRAQMMPAADTEMQRTLCRMAACAEEFWANSSKRIERTRRRAPSEERAVDPPAQPPTTPEPEPERPWADDGDETFWNDMRDMFALGERAFSHEASIDGVGERAFSHEAPIERAFSHEAVDERGLFSE